MKKLLAGLAIVSTCAISGVAYADWVGNITIANHTGYPWVFTQATTWNAGTPIPPLTYPANCGDWQNPNTCPATLPSNASIGPYALLNSGISIGYDICGALNTDNTCNGYLGHLQMTYSDGNPPTATLTQPNGNTYQLTTNAANDIFTVGISLTPPTNFPVPRSYSNILYRGVNLSGYEFGEGAGAPPSHYPSFSDASYFVNQGANMIRIPMEWSYLVPPEAPGSFIPGSVIGGNAYDQTLKAYINGLTQNKVTVILDMHDYMRYSSPGANWNNPVINSPNTATTADLIKVWTYLAQEYGSKNVSPAAGDPNSYVIFDLMNEPFADPNAIDPSTGKPGYPGPNATVAMYNQLIKAIRATGANNLILLEGSNYSGMWSWFNQNAEYAGEESNASAFANGKIVDSANNFAINFHQYFNGSAAAKYSGATYIGSSSTLDPSDICDQPSSFINNVDPNGQLVSWLQQNHYRAFLTEFGAQPATYYVKNQSGNMVEETNTINDPNGVCEADMQELVSYLGSHSNTSNNGTNSGGFVGWTAWSGGNAWTMLSAEYLLDLSPAPVSDEQIEPELLDLNTVPNGDGLTPLPSSEQ